MGLHPRSSGRILLALAIAVAGMYLFVGYLYFLMISNPTVSEITLYRYPMQSYAPSIEGLDWYLKISGLYVLSSFLIGLYLTISLRHVTVERFGWVQIFTMLTPVIFLLPGMMLPFARELLLFLPPAMFILAAANIIHPENRYRQRLIYLGAFTIMPMLLGECFLVAAKPVGAATMYVLMLVTGLSAMSLILFARQEHLKYLSDMIYPDGQRSLLDPDKDAPYSPPHIIIPGKMPPPPHAIRTGPRPAVIIVAAGAVLILAFLPPFWVLNTEPDLEINWQLRSNPASARSARVHVSALVINRGAQAALGHIELNVTYMCRTYPAGSIERIDGFGNCYIEVDLILYNWSHDNRNATITLLFNGVELETQVLKTPALNPLFALVALVVIKALFDKRRSRR